MSGLDPFAEAGFAVYVTQEIGRAEVLLGQSPDAWVSLLVARVLLPPLSELKEVGLPDGQERVYDLLRAALAGGSFMRRLAGEYGTDAVYDVRNGPDVEEILALSLAKAERRWLAAVAAVQIRPLSCEDALPGESAIHGFCEYLDTSSRMRGDTDARATIER